MAEDGQSDDALVRQHVGNVLARLRALKERLRAQEKALRSRSLDTRVEVNREDDHPSGIDNVERPS